jgi:hypothetical protein
MRTGAFFCVRREQRAAREKNQRLTNIRKEVWVEGRGATFACARVFDQCSERKDEAEFFGGEHETTGEDQQRGDEKSGAGDRFDGRLSGLCGSGHGVGSSARGGRSWNWRAGSGSRLCGPRASVCGAAALLWSGVCWAAIGICVLPRTASAVLGCALPLLALPVSKRLALRQVRKKKAPRSLGAFLSWTEENQACVTARKRRVRRQRQRRSGAAHPGRATSRWELRAGTFCRSGTA